LCETDQVLFGAPPPDTAAGDQSRSLGLAEQADHTANLLGVGVRVGVTLLAVWPGSRLDLCAVEEHVQRNVQEGGPGAPFEGGPYGVGGHLMGGLGRADRFRGLRDR